MIVGVVNTNGKALIPLTVRGRGGKRRKIRAIVDTGFNGHLSLPSKMISELDLAWRQLARASLADGSKILFNLFDGAVVWNRRIRDIPIDEAEAPPLVGMALMSGCELVVEVRTGGKVSITALPCVGSSNWSAKVFLRIRSFNSWETINASFCLMWSMWLMPRTSLEQVSFFAPFMMSSTE